ncbi:MAG: hypothetical protein QOE11_555 [Solirubrobacteraceae bacterium]|nr:hypothetical protein [Solirubrobacteraceae bacterium]
MSQTGTSAWWADVQHLRDAAERTDEARRRADKADLAARRAGRERRVVEAEVAPAPALASRQRREVDVPASRQRLEVDVPAPRRRLEADPPPPRRRDHADAANAPHRADGPSVPRRGGFGDPGIGLPGRRTIEIRGRTVPAPEVPRPLEADRTRRPPRRAAERIGPRPDRLAMWALMMGLMLILVAVMTAHAGV